MGYGASLDLPWVKSPEASGNTGDYPTFNTVNSKSVPIFIKLHIHCQKDGRRTCMKFFAVSSVVFEVWGLTIWSPPANTGTKLAKIKYLLI